MKLLDIEILIIRSVILIISTVGCLWHLTDVGRIYFTYETDVNVDFEKDSMVDIPAVTICMNSSLIIREDYIKKRFPQLEKILISEPESKYYQMSEFLRKLTLREQLKEATYGYKEIFNSCLVMTPVEFEPSNEDYVNCTQLSPIREYLTYPKKCFVIASQVSDENPHRFIVDHDTTLRDNGFPLFQIRLNNSFLDRIVMFVHQRTVPFLSFVGGQTNGVHLNNTKYASYTFSFTKTTLDLLPPPYQTKCRDYSEIGYKSLSHCIVDCKADYFLQQFNGWHPEIPANDEYYSDLNVFYAPHKLKENKTLDKIIAERCGNLCGRQEDCHSEYYNLIQIGHFERAPKQTQFHLITLYLPTGINTRYFHSPRLHLTEFICYFGSIFSLWFGFSMITTSKAAIKIYKLYHKARTPVKPGIVHTISHGSRIKVTVADKFFL